MANYKETTLAGTAYTRAGEVVIHNGETFKNIVFHEERVINLDEGDSVKKSAGKVESVFSPENAGTEFALLNPETGEAVGAPMTYQEVYVALYSLYLHLALERDAAEEAAQAEEEPVVEEPVVE